MKKFMLLSVCVCLAFQFVNAQSYKQKPRPKDKYVNINAGIGIVPTFFKDAGKAELLPLSLSTDFKLAKNFSLGVYIGHSVTKTDLKLMRDGTSAQWRNSYTATGVRMAGQSNDLNGWNLYGGMSVGYSHSNIEMIEGDLIKVKDHMGIKDNSGKMLMTGFLGARYSFTPKVGMFGELGMGAALATAGLSIRL
ncbi:MAG: hypothetical protein MI974_22125 [Chitinophagales bacterium]|nr:hypothetical protein [Chitinophagales bacterium]